VISEFVYEFARAGPVGWMVIGKLPGPVFNSSRLCLTSRNFRSKPKCPHTLSHMSKQGRQTEGGGGHDPRFCGGEVVGSP